MEELINRLTQEYNAHVQRCNEILQQIITFKVRDCIDNAKARRDARVKELENTVNAALWKLQQEEAKKAQEKAEKAEQARIKALMIAEEKMKEIISKEEEDWENEKKEAIKEAEGTNMSPDDNLDEITPDDNEESETEKETENESE